MTKSQFIARLLQLPDVNVNACNTNNGWGFDGGIYKQYEANGYIVRIGEACYRHLSSSPFVTLTAPTGKRLIDVTPRANAYLKILEIIEG